MSGAYESGFVVVRHPGGPYLRPSFPLDDVFRRQFVESWTARHRPLQSAPTSQYDEPKDGPEKCPSCGYEWFDRDADGYPVCGMCEWTNAPAASAPSQEPDRG